MRGDGASFNYVDHGQTGNPCGDPMGGAGTGDDEGGALRSQDRRTSGDPVTLDGTVIRIAASTLASLPSGTPALTSNAGRIIATGLRNPFRLTTRPGTSEIWLGDVGWSTWEEINRIRPGRQLPCQLRQRAVLCRLHPRLHRGGPGRVGRPARSGPGPGVRGRHLRRGGVGDRPGQDLWWVDLGGYVHRIAYTSGNQAPVARISANPTSGPVPLAVSFDGWGSSDPQDGTLPAARLSWSLILHHCATPTDCHTHAVQDFNGVASGSFSAPDHEYPACIELRLTATDSGGLTDSTSVRLDPQTVDLTFRSTPTGLQLTVGSSASTTPFTRTVIVGSRNTIAAP